MKRNIFIGIICFILMGSVYGYMNTRDITKIKVQDISVTTNDIFQQTYEITKADQENFSFFIDLIKKSSTVASESELVTHIKEHGNVEIHYQLKNKKVSYSLWYDGSDFFLLKDNEVSIINDSFKRNIASQRILNGLYPNYQAPLLSISNAASNISFSKLESEWHFQKEDEVWYDSSFPETLSSVPEAYLITNSNPLNLDFDINPSKVILQVYNQDLLLYETDIIDPFFHPIDEDGLKTYVIQAEWNLSENQPYYGKASYSMDLFTDLPATLSLDKNETEVGGFFKLIAKNLNSNETPKLSQEIMGSFVLNPVVGGYLGYLPASYHTRPGEYPISFWTEFDDGTATEPIEYSITIKDRDFKIQQLSISTTIEKSTRNDEAYEQYAKYFTPIRENSKNQKLWEGAFIKPVEGRTSTTYGERRYVNNAPTSYRHSGMDIAAPRGTPIMATNSGQVVLAMNLILTGNTIVIDHGLGVFSVYFHCNSLNVEEGQMVQKGNQIATVGSTGFSTGPHLHWTMSIYDQNIDPAWIINNEL